MNFTKKLVFGSVVALAMLAAHATQDMFGRWGGTWEGGGAGGRFDITLTREGETVAGKVDVGQDTGDYSAPFTVATLEGNRLKARYDYPPEPQAEIVLDGTLDSGSASGTWTMVQKGGSDPFAAGTWTVKKQ